MDVMRIKHEFLLEAVCYGPFELYFIAKVLIPVWETHKQKDGTIKRVPGWLPTLLRDARPSGVILQLEKTIRDYVKTGVYRRRPKTNTIAGLAKR